MHALDRAKQRLDRLDLYPRPVSLRGVRIRVVAVALPAAVVPPLRRLRRPLDDPPALARAARRRRPRHPRALPRLADAAPSAADAPLLSIGAATRRTRTNGRRDPRRPPDPVPPAREAAAARPGRARRRDRGALRADRSRAVAGAPELPSARLPALLARRTSPSTARSAARSSLRPRDARSGATSRRSTPSDRWAIYFAAFVRRRIGTRNGRWAGRRPLYPRSYFFVHNRGSASPAGSARGRSTSSRPTRSQSSRRSRA